ncbi:MAG: PHB depolymerase family esterase [Sphingomicrobium sp.]
MPRLGSTIARLTALRKGATPASHGPSRLTETAFSPNPGALVAKTYIPASLKPGAPLVVVLHGCTQDAAVYDRGSGWSQLADRHGFAVLYPEQERGNNFNLCFNWYQAADARRGRGEASSIAHMIRDVTTAHQLDPERVFINGLSAGGAMTMVMLACYPELFAGGAVIAGLPFAVAEGVQDALEAMRGGSLPSRFVLASSIAKASDHRGPWPSLSVWHGTADHVVSSANAGAIVDQWRDRIGLGTVEGQRNIVDGQRRTVWRDSTGKIAVERYDIAGMGHGTPLATRGGEACGQAGPHMLEAGICSTSRLAERWGIATGAGAPRQATPPVARHAPAATGVGAVIEDALRAAGLMR